ncbi:MAG TPA: thioredoxin domain-containing protein [Vicinamibacterales bacterium]|nr:thioredoxin domain-containing protein [Vicinamibacterales bacterium]
MVTTGSVWVLAAAIAMMLFVPADRHGARAAQDAGIAAIVDGQTITIAEVDEAAGVKLAVLEQQVDALRRHALDDLVGRAAIDHAAARQHTTPAALVQREVAARTMPITDAEVERFYAMHKGALEGEATNDQIRQAIRIGIEQQRRDAADAAVRDSFRSHADVTIRLAPSPLRRFRLDTAGEPALGPADAPVTLVEFSDFHCPFCKRLEDTKTLPQLRERYGDRLRIVWIDDPLDSLHPQSRAAHQAAQCAAEQGRFWAFHDQLYVGAPKSRGDLDAVARTIGLDTEAFDACVASGRTRAAVERGVDQARRLSVSGTPTFFVNGRPLVGAQPLEAFIRVIDEELVGADGRRGGPGQSNRSGGLR